VGPFCERSTQVRGKVRVTYAGVFDIPFRFEVIRKP
jgi:hypothetical protein